MGAGSGSGRAHAEMSFREIAFVREFNNLRYEWVRLFAELFGTYLLVVVAAGAGTVNTITHGGVGRVAEVSAPGLMVMAIILSLGAVSGAHLNPVVTIAFAFRTDFQWRRVPGYIVAQLSGATLASVTLLVRFGRQDADGATLPGPGISDGQAMIVEALLTLGLVTTILGAASGAQNVGALSALAAGGYVILAGMWASPASGASMNPARSSPSGLPISSEVPAETRSPKMPRKVVGALGAGLLPARVLPYLGLLPLALGIRAAIIGWWRRTDSARDDDGRVGSSIWAVAVVTVSNGGDNIGVYVPVFATAGIGGMSVYCILFLVFLAALVVVARFLATRKPVARTLARWGHIILPVVLIGIGLRILIDGGAFGIPVRS